MVYSMELAGAIVLKDQFMPIFINQVSFTKLNDFICHIDLPDTITLYKGVIEMFNLINLNQETLR